MRKAPRRARAQGSAEGPSSVHCTACGRAVGPGPVDHGPPLPILCPACLGGNADIALRLRSLRIAAGVSRLALAGELELSPRTIARYERGQATPGPAQLGKLIDVLTVLLLRRRPRTRK